MIGHDRPRVVALDYGHKRVGIAMSDPLGFLAQPLGTLAPEAAVSRLLELAEEPGLEAIVIGWPLLPDGSEGKATERVQMYINRLAKRMSVPIIKWDERYTSEAAKDILAQVGGSRKKRRDKGRVDTTAAVIILQEYLDGQ